MIGYGVSSLMVRYQEFYFEKKVFSSPGNFAFSGSMKLKCKYAMASREIQSA